MTKSDLVSKLAKRHPYMSARDSEVVVNSIFNAMLETITSGGKVELRGFGVFGTKLRKARQAKNPKTGETIQIGERYSVFFRMGKRIQSFLNEEE